MLEHPLFLGSLVLLLLFGLFSRLSEQSIFTAPMIFVTAGLIISLVIPAEIRDRVEAPWVKLLAELTLILVLFVDSSTLDLKALSRQRQLPVRLLLIGLPMTMAIGFLVALRLFSGESVWMLALMALILSPTDAALGMAVVTSDKVPLRVRQTINVESGLNDGISLPPILVCLAVLAGTEPGDNQTGHWAIFVLKQFLFGPLVGGAVGWLGGTLIERASKRGWMSESYQRLASLPIAVLAFSAAEMIHGNGFIAAFFSGALLGTKTPIYRERIHGFGETLGQVLVLGIFLLFGLVLVPLAFPWWDWTALVYAILSLTIIRMLPVFLCLLGTGLDFKTINFIGWFGPRGIASVLYLLMAVIQIKAEGHERIFSVIVLTVLMSIFLHGMSAVPLSKIFGTGNKATTDPPTHPDSAIASSGQADPPIA